MVALVDAGFCIKQPRGTAMTMNLENSKSYFSNRLQSRAFEGLLPSLAVQSRSASSEGYAFETAFCFVESQSPLLRPGCARSIAADPAEIGAHETAELSSRVSLLTKLLAGVSGHIDPEEMRSLLDAAGGVTSELIAVLGPPADRRSIDPSVSHGQRQAAAEALVRARLLQEKISSDLDALSHQC
jgi:hypothetical protein